MGPDRGRRADDAVALAMTAIPRRGFLLPRDAERAGYDGPIPIGEGQTNSQPRTVADMLRLLDVRHGHRVLDVGAGTGWTTALLAHLVGPSGLVIGVERVPSLAERAVANIRVAGLPWARVALAEPGVLGHPGAAPFDRILVSAEAQRLPASLVAQVRVGGVLVIPVKGRMLRVVRTEEGHEVGVHGHYRFVPLIE